MFQQELEDLNQIAIKIQSNVRGYLVRQDIRRQLQEWFQAEAEKIIADEEDQFNSQYLQYSSKDNAQNEYYLSQNNNESNQETNLKHQQQLPNYKLQQSDVISLNGSSLELDNKVREKIRQHQEQVFLRKQLATTKEQIISSSDPPSYSTNNTRDPTQSKRFPQIIPFYSYSYFQEFQAGSKQMHLSKTISDIEELPLAITINTDSQYKEIEASSTISQPNQKSQRIISVKKPQTFPPDERIISGQDFLEQPYHLSILSLDLSQNKLAESNNMPNTFTMISQISSNKEQSSEMDKFDEQFTLDEESLLSQNGKIINISQSEITTKPISSHNRSSIHLKNHKNIQKLSILNRIDDSYINDLHNMTLQTYEENCSIDNKSSFESLNKGRIESITQESLLDSSNIRQQRVQFEFDRYVQAAASIQRTFRGFTSRKNILNFHQVKRAALLIESSYISFKQFLVKKMKQSATSLEMCAFTIIKLVQDFEKGEQFLQSQFKKINFDEKIKISCGKLSNAFCSFLNNHGGFSLSQLQTPSIVDLENEVKLLKKQIKKLEENHKKEITDMQTKFEDLSNLHRETIKKYISSIQIISDNTQNSQIYQEQSGITESYLQIEEYNQKQASSSPHKIKIKKKESPYGISRDSQLQDGSLERQLSPRRGEKKQPKVKNSLLLKNFDDSNSQLALSMLQTEAERDLQVIDRKIKRIQYNNENFTNPNQGAFISISPKNQLVFSKKQKQSQFRSTNEKQVHRSPVSKLTIAVNNHQNCHFLSDELVLPIKSLKYQPNTKR